MRPEAMRQERFRRLSQALKAAGLKLTGQRLRVCEVLAESETHPTVHEVFDQARRMQPGISLATVYNTMNTLQDLGLISEIGSTSDGSLHYELNPEPHLNLICLGCDRIVDLPPDDFLKPLVAGAERDGYQVVGTKLVLYGYCNSCRRKKEEVRADNADLH